MTKKIIAVSTGQLFRSNRLNDNFNQKPIFVMQNMDLVIHFFPDEDSSDKVIEKELTRIIKNINIPHGGESVCVYFPNHFSPLFSLDC